METTKDKILFDQVEDLYTNLRYANWAVILISSFLVWMLWDVADRRALLAWDIAILLVTAGRHILAFFYGQTHVSREDIRFWLRSYVGGVLVSGVLWGLVPVFIVPPDEIFYLVATIFLMGGLVTGSAATLASLKYGFSFFSIPAILPGAIYLMYINQPFTFLIGCSLFVFLVFILFVALGMHRTIYYSLRQQVEVSNKLSEMESQKMALDHQIEKLEKQLTVEREEKDLLRASLKHKKQAGTMVRRTSEFRDERFLSLLEHLTGGVWDINLKAKRALYSAGWLDMLGYDSNDVVGGMKFWESLLHPDDKLKVLDKMQMFIDGKSPEYSSSHRLKSKSGKWVWVMGRAYGVVWDDFGELLNIICMEIFVPENGEIAKQSLDLINFDIDEWLFSREKFDGRLMQLVKAAAVDSIEHSVCHLQIIEMSDAIEDDGTLAELYFYEVGRMLLHQFRHGDAIMRLDRTSYALIMEFCRIDDAWEKAVALQKALSEQKMNFRGREHNITVAIGITPVSSDGRTLPDIMADARTASEMAVSSSNNMVYLYQNDDQDVGSNLFEKQYVHGLKETMAAGKLGITAMPLRRLDEDASPASLFIVDVDLGRDVPDYMAGVDYAAIVAKNNLFPAIDLNAVTGVLKWLEASLDDGLPDIQHQTYLYECDEASYRDPEFLQDVIKQVNLHFRAARFFCLGIQEAIVLNGGGVIVDFIENIRRAGGKVALTHAGSTNLLASIKDYDLDFLKLDNAILQALDNDPSSYLTVKYLNDLVHLREVKSIVEGAEDSLHGRFGDISIDFLHDTSTANGVSRIN